MRHLILCAALLSSSCVTKQFVRDALTVEQITCALLTESLDVAEVKAICKITDALVPVLRNLLVGKANARARSGSQTR